jgi:cytochrome b561
MNTVVSPTAQALLTQKEAVMAAAPTVDSAEPSVIPPRHAKATMAQHGLSVLAIVVSAAAALARELTEDKALCVVLMDVRRQVGLLVLVALVLRLMVRYRKGMADQAGTTSPLERWAAQLAHLSLYAMLFVMPPLGLAVSNAHAVHIKLFGFIPLPSLVGEDADLADQPSDWHLWGAWAPLALVLVHVAAACWHHWVKRDGVLAAMLPLVKPRR